MHPRLKVYCGVVGKKMPNMNKQECATQVQKDMYVLHLCVQACTQGNALQRNPYVRSPRTKKNLQALHEAIAKVTQDILILEGQLAKEHIRNKMIGSYYRTYSFLFEFNDGIRREEYDHLILLRDQAVLGKFTRLRYHTDSLLQLVM